MHLQIILHPASREVTHFQLCSHILLKISKRKSLGFYSPERCPINCASLHRRRGASSILHLSTYSFGGGGFYDIRFLCRKCQGKGVWAFGPHPTPIPLLSWDAPVPVRVSTGASCSAHTALEPRLMPTVSGLHVRPPIN